MVESRVFLMKLGILLMELGILLTGSGLPALVLQEKLWTLMAMWLEFENEIHWNSQLEDASVSKLLFQ